MNKSCGPGHGQESVKGPYEEGTDGETSRKAESANKVMSGDAGCAQKSILPPLAPERSSKRCKKHQAERRVAQMKCVEEEHSQQQAESSGHEKGATNTSAGRSEK